MEAHALGVGYVPMVRGRTHFLRVRSNFHRSLNVDDVEVHPPKMYMEFSTKILKQDISTIFTLMSNYLP